MQNKNWRRIAYIMFCTFCILVAFGGGYAAGFFKATQVIADKLIHMIESMGILDKLNISTADFYKYVLKG